MSHYIVPNHAENAKGFSTKDLPKNIRRLIRRIKSLQLEMSFLQGEIESSKDSISLELLQYCVEELELVLPVIYWSDPCLAKTVRDVFQLRIGGPWSNSQKRVESVCSECHRESKITISSWSQLKNKYNRVCKSCRTSRDQRRDEMLPKYEREEAEWKKEISRLRALPYKDYLQTDHWKDTRYRALRRAGFRCQLCNTKTKLNVHHRTYEHLGYEYYSDLIVLCQDYCHPKFHDKLPLPPSEGGQ